MGMDRQDTTHFTKNTLINMCDLTLMFT